MKKIIKTTLSGALILTAGISLAAMSTTNPGLPQNWAITSARGYGAQTGINGNPASAMCVECHSVNPSGKIADIEQNGAITIANTANANWGSHFVMNAVAGGGTNPWGTTKTGGAANTTGKYERVAQWVDANGGYSKYGSTNSLATVAQGSRGEMICESCHSLTENFPNTASTADNDLLLAPYQDNVNDAICLGCHVATGTGAGTYAGFHTGDNLVAFDGTRTKRHHVLTNDVLSVAATHYGTQGTDSLMWAPKASTRLAATWCTTKYSTTPGAYALNVDLDAGTTPAIAFRGACNVGGQGTRAVATIGVTGAGNAAGDIVPVNATTVNCSNCHRPHNAKASAGAMLFRTGAGGDFVGKVSGNFSSSVAADVEYGIRRSSDVGGRTFQDYLPLCVGCHLGYN